MIHRDLPKPAGLFPNAPSITINHATLWTAPVGGKIMNASIAYSRAPKQNTATIPQRRQQLAVRRMKKQRYTR